MKADFILSLTKDTAKPIQNMSSQKGGGLKGKICDGPANITNQSFSIILLSHQKFNEKSIRNTDNILLAGIISEFVGITVAPYGMTDMKLKQIVKFF